jgi:hypothetical protein
VLDRYGLVVLGYSGSDEAIGRALRATRSRYGLYCWYAAECSWPRRRARKVERLAGVYETLIAVCLDVRERSGRRANDGACSGNRPIAMM